MTLFTLHSNNLINEPVPCTDLKNPNSKDLFIYDRNWLKRQFDDGLVIIKIDSPKEALIEYIPAEKAWKPILAPGYIFVNHLYVEEDSDDQWLKSELLQQCETNNSNSNGIVILLDNDEHHTEGDFYLQRGYLEYAHLPGFNLLVKKFKAEAPSPVFTVPVEEPEFSPSHGITIKYAEQSAFGNYYIYAMKKDLEDMGFKVRLQKLNSAREARESGSPYGTFGVFLDGHFLTHKILNGPEIEDLIGSVDLNEIFPEFTPLDERGLAEF